MKYKSIITISFYLFFNIIFLSSAIAIEKLKAHGGPVKGLTISNDQKLIASASFDYSAVLWGLNPTKDLVTLIGHDAAVNTLKFSPDNSILATGGDDNQLLLWNVKKSLLLEGEIEPIKLLGHKGKIVDLAFNSSSGALTAGSFVDGTGVTMTGGDATALAIALG